MRMISLLLLALAGPAAAQTPEDFAWQWPIEAAGEEGAQVLALDEAVYARITRPDLRDLAVFNTQGQPVPFAPLPQAQATREEREALPWLRVPAPAPEQEGESLSLRLQRDADGRLRDLQLETQSPPVGTTTGAAPSRDLLIDLGEDRPAVSMLRLTLGEQAVLPVNLRVDVSGSDDLAQWDPLAGGLALVAIVDGELRIERLRLDFNASNHRYLRLSLPAGQDWPPLAKIEQERRETGPRLADWQELALEGRAVEGEPGVFEYRSPGPLPVGRVDLRLPQANTVAMAFVESRDGAQEQDYWQLASGFTVFRLGSGDDEVRHLAESIDARRDRHWRVRTEPAMAQAPTLVLSWRPDRFVMLAQGTPPFRLLAGSARAERPDYPVQAALAAAGASRPPGWEPPVARLGEGGPAAGEHVLSPDRGPEYRRWLLWGVLALGAGLVLVVSLRVLRHPPAP